MHFQGDFPDFVQKEGALVGQFDLADFAVLMRAGKRAARIAEQLGLKEILGDGRAVDADQRAFGARAFGVQGMGKEFLARAGGSQNQHRRVQLGVASHLLLEAAHGRAFAQNAAQAVLRGQAGLDPAFVLIEGVPQVVDLGGELFQLFGIVENGLGDHARQPPLAVAHRNAVDHHGQGVAGPELAEFAHFGPAVAQHHARARVRDDFSDVAAQQFFGPPAQQIGIGLVHEADDVVHVAEQHAHGQAVQNEGGHFAVFCERGHGKLLDRAAPRAAALFLIQAGGG